MRRSAKLFVFIVLAVIAAISGFSFIVVYAHTLVGPDGRTITITNNTSQTIWAAAAGNAGFAAPNNGGWEMAPGAKVSVTVANNWQGRFWGRTECTFNGSNNPCATANCGPSLQCNGASGAGPQTLAEFTLGGWGGNDFYDVSYVDGFNVPMTITPVGGAQPDPNNKYRCGVAGCGNDLNPGCPSALQLKDSSGKIVGCKSACNAFGIDQYCCEGIYVGAACNPKTWPVNYAAYFKSQCPDAYSYAYDDATSTFTDTNADYSITFGPPGGSTIPTTTSTTPAKKTGTGFTSGTETPADGQTLFWFKTNNWDADYVIVHFKVSGESQQNIRMTYNTTTGRWEYTAGGFEDGLDGTYAFTFSQNGKQTDTDFKTWTQQSSTISAPNSGTSVPNSGLVPTTTYSGPPFDMGVDTTNNGQTLFWFQPKGWSADYVIIHYNVPNAKPQNVRMTYNTAARRWEYATNDNDDGYYAFTFSQNGRQTDTGFQSWAQPNAHLLSHP